MKPNGLQRNGIVMSFFFSFFLLFCCFVKAASVDLQPGDSFERVVEVLGQPRGVMAYSDHKVFMFGKGTVSMCDGKVLELDVTEASIKRNSEREKQKYFEASQRKKQLVNYEGRWINEDKARQLKTQKEALVVRRQQTEYPAGRIVGGVPCSYNKHEKWNGLIPEGYPAQGTYHYDVYIPADYYEHPRRKYPCLFIASPGGRARLGAIGERIREEGWFAVMLVESSNQAGWSVMAGNFVAAYDDVMKKFRINKKACFATGFSGGARAVTLFACLRNLSGLILQGAGFWWDAEKGRQVDCIRSKHDLPVYALFGSNDPNKSEVSILTENVKRLKTVVFDGGHTWVPERELDPAVDWLKEQTNLR